jgi:hypothetical protein
MKKLFLATAIAVPFMAGTPSLAQSSASQGSATYTGTLTPLNNSGVSGTFTIEQRGQGQIRVSIQARGLEVTSQPHVAHIHGPANGDAMCPTMAQDTDGDGYVELAEGQTTYGPIIVPLGDVDPDNDGVVNYSMTFNLNKDSSFDSGKSKSDLLPLDMREIVIHGLSVPAVGQGTPGEVNGTAGYKVVLPVACGEITKSSGGTDPMRFRTK